MQGSPSTRRQLQRPDRSTSRHGTCYEACFAPCPQISRLSPKRPETHRPDTIRKKVLCAPSSCVRPTASRSQSRSGFSIHPGNQPAGVALRRSWFVTRLPVGTD